MGKKALSLLTLIIVDLLVIFISFWVSFLLRSEVLPHLFPKFKTVHLLPFSVILDNYYMAFVWIFVFAHERLYTKRFPFSNEIKALLKSATISTIIIMIMIFITRKQVKFSRTIVILAWLLSLLLFPIFRYLTKIFLIKAGLWQKKLIILGVNPTSLSILRSIHKNKTMGYEVLGFLEDDFRKKGKKYFGIEVLGPISELERIISKYKSKDIMVSTPYLERKELKEFLSKCEELSESMWIIPRSGNFLARGVEIEVYGDVPTLYRKKNLAKPWNIVIKTLFDKILALTLIILLIPLFLIIALTIKLDSKGPVIFKQKRIGRQKKIFTLYKFRSMHVDSHSKLATYLANNPEVNEEWKKYKKIKGHDPRVTKVGKIIRRFSLDELPQLLNVLQGKMSLVGPRPYLAEELEGNDPFIKTIIQVKPGITGPWQVSGRSEIPFKERLRLDEYYIRNWSLGIDLIILLKSLGVIFSKKGAY